MANTNVIWRQVAHTNYHPLAAQQEPYIQQTKKTLNEKCLTVFWEKSAENGPLAEMWQGRPRGLGRKTKGEL